MADIMTAASRLPANPFAATKKAAPAGSSQGARHTPHPFGKTVSKPAASTPTPAKPVASVSRTGGNAPVQTGSRAANNKLGKARGSIFGGY